MSAQDRLARMPPPAPEGMNKWLLIAMVAMIGTGLFASLRARRQKDNPMALTPLDKDTAALEECLADLAQGDKPQTVYSAEGDELKKQRNNGVSAQALLARCVQVRDAKNRSVPVPPVGGAGSL